MITYYGAKDTCSIPAQIILNMSGVEYENIYLDFEHPLREEYLKINPTGQVPTLIENGEVFTQCVGITTYLADKNPQLNMTPELNSPLRGHYNKWMHFLNSTIHETYLRIYYPQKFAETEQGASEVLNAAKAYLAKSFAVADSWLDKGTYCLGDHIQACDLYLVTLLTWHENLEQVFEQHPKLQTLYKAVLDHNAVRAVFEEHGTEL